MLLDIDQDHITNPNGMLLAPECRNHQPLVPFRSPGEPCQVHVCKVKYNYVYIESHPDSTCLSKFFYVSLLSAVNYY